MDKRRVDIYQSTLKMAEDPTASASERAQAMRYLKTMEDKYPGIADEANGTTTSDGTAERDFWGGVVDFLKNANRAAQQAGHKARLANLMSTAVVTTLKQSARNGRAVVTITFEPDAVNALLDASALDRGVALAVLATATRAAMVTFFTPE